MKTDSRRSAGLPPASTARVKEAHDRIASRFRSRFLRHYVASKLSRDPLYAAVAERLRGHSHPLIDVGCGVGLMALYLREHGYRGSILGIDHDAAKISQAQRVAPDPDVEFSVGDARSAIRPGSSVLLLDVLHYFAPEQQRQLLAAAADAVPAGGVVIVRDGVRDHSWRYRLTYAAEVFARAVLWLKAERLSFPTRDGVIEPFRSRGFEVEETPLWGSTPFNNYLFVFRRPESGTTKE